MIPQQSAHTRGAERSRQLRILITDLASGQPKTSVKIPLALVDAGMKIGARFVPEVAGVDAARVKEAIHGSASGKILDVTDDEAEERIELFVE